MGDDTTQGISRRQVLKGAAVAGVAVAGGGIMAACAPSTSPSGATGSQSAASPGVPASIGTSRALKVWMPWPNDFSIVQKLIETTVTQYEATYAGKKVEVTGIAWDEIGPKLAAGRLSGDLPDVFAPDTERGTAYFNDLLPPPGQCLRLAASADDDWVQAGIEGWSFDGELHGIPAICGTKCYIYRKDFFEEAGLTAFPRTWDEFRAAELALVQRDGSGNITRSAEYWGRTGDNQHITSYAVQNGGAQFDPADPSTGASAVASPEFLKAFSWYFDRKRVDKTAPLTGTVLNPGEWASISGKAAMETQGPWWIPAIVKSVPADAEKLAVGLPLEGPNGRAGVGDQGGTLCVRKGTDVLDDAYNFLRIFLEEDNYLAYHDALEHPESPFAALTGRKSMNEKLSWIQTDFMKTMPEWVEALDYGINVGWKHVAAQEMELNLWGPAMERAVNSILPDADILAELAGAMDAATDRAIRLRG